MLKKQINVQGLRYHLKTLWVSLNQSSPHTVLTINSIVYGLQYLFLESNPDDPLNKEAADELRRDRNAFDQNAQRAVRGGSVGGVQFQKCLAK